MEMLSLPQVIEMLLENGVDINYVADNHQMIQPLHWAALRGNTQEIPHPNPSFEIRNSNLDMTSPTPSLVVFLALRLSGWQTVLGSTSHVCGTFFSPVE